MSIKVLPTIPDITQEKLPIQTFKSQGNLRIEKERKTIIITNSITISLEPNTSGVITVDLKNDFGYTPYVTYNVLCKDNLFGLCHYLTEITSKSFILTIQNETIESRNITINYKVR